MKYKVKKTALSYEQKKVRALDYIDFTGQHIDVEAFCAREIFDETVDMICNKCKYTENVEYDILQEMTFGLDIPELMCPECDGTMKPELVK